MHKAHASYVPILYSSTVLVATINQICENAHVYVPHMFNFSNLVTQKLLGMTDYS